jgi:DNA-binding LytR/AlgR family response regulator
MTQTHTIDVTRNLYSFSGVENVSTIFKEEQPSRIQKNNEGVMALPVNNYLKTPDEIEMEFRYGINLQKLSLRKESLKDIKSITTTDGYLNIHSLDEALSGIMEENY